MEINEINNTKTNKKALRKSKKRRNWGSGSIYRKNPNDPDSPICIRYRSNGKRKSETIGNYPGAERDAKRRLAIINGKKAQGKVLISSKTRENSTDLIDQWYRSQLANTANEESLYGKYCSLIKHFGNKPMSVYTPDYFRNMQIDIKEKGMAPGSINKLFDNFGRVCNFHDLCGDELNDPFKGYKPLKDPTANGRKKIYDDDEFECIVNEVKDREDRDMFWLLRRTGFRVKLTAMPLKWIYLESCWSSTRPLFDLPEELSKGPIDKKHKFKLPLDNWLLQHVLYPRYCNMADELALVKVRAKFSRKRNFLTKLSDEEVLNYIEEAKRYVFPSAILRNNHTAYLQHLDKKWIEACKRCHNKISQLKKEGKISKNDNLTENYFVGKTIHDIRRTRAMEEFRKRGNIFDAMIFLDHKNHEATMRYLHLTQRDINQYHEACFPEITNNPFQQHSDRFGT